MKASVYAVVVMLGITGGACAADFEDLSGKNTAGLRALADVTPQVPAPLNIVRDHCSRTDLVSVPAARKGAEAVLANPEAFTVKQMGDVLVNIDEVCICLPLSLSDRRGLDALRDAVNIAQREKVRRHLGAGKPDNMVPDKAAVRKNAQAILANPGTFTVKQMGDVLVNLDVVRSSLSASSGERAELDALRDAVNNVQREKVRQAISHRN